MSMQTMFNPSFHSPYPSYYFTWMRYDSPPIKKDYDLGMDVNRTLGVK